MSDKSKMLADKAHAEERWLRKESARKPPIPTLCWTCGAEATMQVGSRLYCDDHAEAAAAKIGI